jgi:hypothetical protein
MGKNEKGRDMSKQCKCEHWQQCPVCMPHRFDKNGHLLPPEPTPLQAARIRIEELEVERDQLRAKINVLREALSSAESALDESRDYPVTYDEVITALITRMTGHLAPGKDAAAGSYDETANRREIYARWDEIHGECVYAVLDAVDYVLRTSKDDEE